MHHRRNFTIRNSSEGWMHRSLLVWWTGKWKSMCCFWTKCLRVKGVRCINTSPNRCGLCQKHPCWGSICFKIQWGIQRKESHQSVFGSHQVGIIFFYWCWGHSLTLFLLEGCLQWRVIFWFLFPYQLKSTQCQAVENAVSTRAKTALRSARIYSTKCLLLFVSWIGDCSGLSE